MGVGVEPKVRLDDTPIPNLTKLETEHPGSGGLAAGQTGVTPSDVKVILGMVAR